MAAATPAGTTFDVPGLSRSEIAQRVDAVLVTDGAFRSVGLSPDAREYVRSERPRWASIAAVALALPTLGAALLLLLVRRTRSCTVSILERPHGRVVTVTGEVPPAQREALARSLRDRARPAGPGGAPPATSPDPGPAPGLGAGRAPRADSSGASAPAQPAPILPRRVPIDERDSDGNGAPASARPAAGAATLTEDAAETRTDPAGIDRPIGPGPGSVLCFDDGTRLPLRGTVLVGRDPEALPGDPEPVPVVLPDPDRTVSKTHVAFRPGVGGAWVEDRSSTNGTMAADAEGQSIQLVPGVPLLVAHGCYVMFGRRWLEVRSGG